MLGQNPGFQHCLKGGVGGGVKQMFKNIVEEIVNIKVTSTTSDPKGSFLPSDLHPVFHSHFLLWY